MARVLVCGLALAGALAGAAGVDGLAFYVLLAAVPVAAGGLLTTVGELVELGAGPGRAALSGLTLAIVLVAAALRAPELALGCLLTTGVEQLGSHLAGRPLPET